MKYTTFVVRMTTIAILMLTVGLTSLPTSSILAQELPPILVPVDVPQKNLTPIQLSKLSVDARIFGYMTETSLTMTFYNPNSRQLAGDLYFPLPEGATVSGYALDISGRMVDGSVVEKAKGRQVFEKIVRQGIDPGLVEWVKGNNFKTRVFPIPAKGTRTITIRYVSDLVSGSDGPLYRLPLNFKEKIKAFFIRVEAVKTAKQPVITGGNVAGLSFGKWRDSFVAEAALKNVALIDDLVIAVPVRDTQAVAVEQDEKGDVYFCLNDLPAVPARAQDNQAPEPARVVIYWDSSLSRQTVDHQKELDVLKRYFAQFKETIIEVKLVVFSNTVNGVRTCIIENGSVDELIAAIGHATYDGGTSLSSLSLYQGVPLADLALVFTDGISNFGREEPENTQVPLYLFSTGSVINPSFLRYLAIKSGGAYCNLELVDVNTAVTSIGHSAYSFISATCSSENEAEMYPSIPEKIDGRFTLCGKLLIEKAAITLNYGINGRIHHSYTVTISGDQAEKGTLIRRYWAQKKVDELQIFSGKNEKEIVRTGKKYGLVTPFTSMIVLDNYEQYLEHRILPPKTLSKMRARYLEAIEREETRAEEEKEQKIDTVVRLWNDRVAWWETEFTYPKGFRYRGGGEDKSMRDSAPGGEIRSSLSSRSESREDVMMEMSEDESDFSASIPQEEAPREALAAAPAKKAKASEGATSTPQPAIVIKAWDPQTPYVKAIKDAEAGDEYRVYRKHRDQYGTSPAFFLDCADVFFNQKDSDTALRVLSNIAELELENAALLRVLGHRLAQMDKLDLAILVFEEVLKLRPEEPQSYRDLALVLARRGDYRRAIELLYHVVLNQWDRFAEIELIALMELNNILDKAQRAGEEDLPYVDERLVKNLEVDVRIILTWDADLTDIDLWVIEPSEEKAFYSHRRTTIGGNFSRDFTQGYGPEEYMVRKAMNGMYDIKTNFFGSSAQQLIGSVTLQVDVFTHYGRENENRKSITLRLKERKETVDIGEIEF